MIRQIDVHELKEWTNAGKPLLLLDVRQPWEHQLAALPASVLIPLNELPLRGHELQPPANATVVVYCHHGIRSRTGVAILQQLGFDNVVSLAGGIDAWSKEIDPDVRLY